MWGAVYVVVHDLLTGDRHILHKLQLYTIIFTSLVQCGPVYIVVGGSCA